MDNISTIYILWVFEGSNKVISEIFRHKIDAESAVRYFKEKDKEEDCVDRCVYSIQEHDLWESIE